MQFAIAHAAWLPDRRRTLARILDQLAPVKPMIFASLRREHAAEWATRLWEWCAEHDGDGVCCLNDDVILHPHFVREVEAIASALPDEVVSLHTNVPGAREAQQRGAAWIRCYWLTGPGYILPPGAARSILNWEAPWSFLSRINEDQRAIHWMWEHQRPAWCAIPAPVIHDVSTKSSLGYDHHPNRTPTVPFTDYTDLDLEVDGYWCRNDDAVLLPNPWMPHERLDLIRRLLKEGRPICVLCLNREGIVGPKNGDFTLCNFCVSACSSALLEGRGHVS